MTGRRRQQQRKAFLFGSVLAAYMLVFFVGVSWLGLPSNDNSVPWSPSRGDGAATNTPSCPWYGCPIYPAELTPYLHQLLEKYYGAHKEGDISDEDRSIKDLLSFGSEDFALLTQQGKSHYVNQDRAVLISPYTVFPDQNADDNEDMLFMGIFDGHGQEGHIVADYVTRDLPERLATALQSIPKQQRSKESIVQALNQSIVEVDVYAPPNFLLGGSTATVTLKWKTHLFMANVGDSYTRLISIPRPTPTRPVITREDVQIVYETKPHKARFPEEYQRITQLGGNIHINPKTNDSRVVVYSVAARDQIALAMSRSLGDWEWKAVGVTAEPHIDVLDLTFYYESPEYASSSLFVVAGSDGVWEKRWAPFFAKQFSESFLPDPLSDKSPPQTRKEPLQKAWEVLQQITPKAQKGYRDDMTVIVQKL